MAAELQTEMTLIMIRYPNNVKMPVIQKPLALPDNTWLIPVLRITVITNVVIVMTTIANYVMELIRKGLVRLAMENIKNVATFALIILILLFPLGTLVSANVNLVIDNAIKLNAITKLILSILTYVVFMVVTEILVRMMAELILKNVNVL